MREPPFWWRQDSPAAALLSPLAAIYGAVAAHRMARTGWKAGVPVVCIGNPTVGGAGKTPVALAVARMLESAGEAPAFLSRGYGGRACRTGAGRSGPASRIRRRRRAAAAGAHRDHHRRARPRAGGAQAAVAAGAGVIVMDDGFQNPSLAKDFSVLVVDARRGIGNGRAIPAGPLRAPLDAQLDRAQALIVVGEGDAAGVIDAARRRSLPVFKARLAPDAAFIASLAGRRVLAFAGIGDPEKFFATLREAGVAVAATRSFDDHHRYTQAEAQVLRDEAHRTGLVLVTTEKDLARMQEDRRCRAAHRAGARAAGDAGIRRHVGFRSLLRERIAHARAGG